MKTESMIRLVRRASIRLARRAARVCRRLAIAAAAGLIAAGLFGAGAARADTVPGEILLKLRVADAVTPLLAKYGLTITGRFGARPIFRLRFATPPLDVHAVLEALLLEPDVLLAEENAIHASPEARKNRVWAIGSAQDFAQQWAPAALRLNEAHRFATGSGVRVAVLDTGIDASHPLFAARLLPGHDFVGGDANPAEEGSRNDLGFGHGTHVAGIVASAAPGAKIMPIRVLDRHGEGNAWVLAEAILYAIDPDGNPATDDGAHVINLSLGSRERTEILDTIAHLASCSFPAVPDPLDPEGDVSDPGYNVDRERCSYSSGAVVVAAAGNEGSRRREYPAGEGAYGLLAVTASSEVRELAQFSNFGSWVHLAAPGDAITSSVPGPCPDAAAGLGACFGTWSGTSMAAPWVAATAALLREREPALTPVDVAQRIRQFTSPLRLTRLRQVDPVAALLQLNPAPQFPPGRPDVPRRPPRRR
jgi:subtilisin family serine protease